MLATIFVMAVGCGDHCEDGGLRVVLAVFQNLPNAAIIEQVWRPNADSSSQTHS